MMKLLIYQIIIQHAILYYVVLYYRKDDVLSLTETKKICDQFIKNLLVLVTQNHDYQCNIQERYQNVIILPFMD